MRGVLVLSFLLAPPSGEGWWGRDKVKHFLIGAFAQSAAYASWQAAGADRQTALIAASLSTAALGTGKELYDRQRGGRFSTPDLAWTLGGGMAASVVLVRTER